MSDETPTLSIKDIVLLKERPQDYLKIHAERLTKTHDGTSSGPIKSNIKNFIYSYSQDPFKRIVAFDSTGNKMVDEFTHYHNYPLYEEGDYINNKNKDMHIIMNNNYSAEGMEISDGMYEHNFSGTGKATIDRTNFTQAERDITFYINETDAKQLTLKNADDEYAVRSITMVSPNKETMTLVKNNDFSEADHEQLLEVMRNADNMTFENSSEYEELIGPELEKCNVKVKFQKNSDIEAKPEGKWEKDRFKDVENLMDMTDIYFNESDVDTSDFIGSTVGANGGTIHLPSKY